MFNPYNPVEDFDEVAGDYSSAYLYDPDDEKFFTQLIKDNWSICDMTADCDNRPYVYYNDGNHATRDNSSGGSIYVYRTSFQFPKIVGINYDASSMSCSMCIDIQNPKNRQRHLIWVREVVRILHDFRRAGKARLNGWDYLDVDGVNPRSQNYNNYFQTVIDFKLSRAVSGIDTDGFGHEIRKTENE